MLPPAMVGEGCVAKTPHPFEIVATVLCPLPQGERAREATPIMSFVAVGTAVPELTRYRSVVSPDWG